MGLYKIEWKRSARKELRKLPSDVIRRIVREAEQLSEEPYPRGHRKIAGTEHTYRIRVGDYRIVYTVVASLLLIEVIRVAHRKDVYR